MSTELYLIHTGFLEDEEIFYNRLRRVSEERRIRVEACKAAEDKRRSLAAGLLLEELLRQNYFSPSELIRDEKGKLAIPGQEALYFNLSHSGEYAACVISDQPVGVDIQMYRPVKEGIAKRFFLPQETASLKEHRGKVREGMFFRYWTGKESYIKLTGEGFRKSFNSFFVNLEENRIHDKKDPSKEIFLREYFCLRGYALTVASYENNFGRFVKKIYYKL